MDRLEGLTSQLSQITMYDIKSMYNQAKNVVLNVSETEAKVREATNDDPWGASSTLMQEIAQGTFNFQQFNEIMPSIYSRFMEKEARQWRQIYKALQLLEYLIKHGSERVVDDARSHISTIKMLRNFHYIDDKGKDEGINVRNRSRELVELLSDVEKIRAERRKAKANKHKYTGTGNDGFGFGSGGSRYGGFGNDSLGGGSGYSGGGSSSYEREYGGYSGGGGGSSGGFRDDSRRGGFEEYNAGDDEVPVRRSNSISQRPTAESRSKAAAPPPKPKEPEVDLLGGFDEEPAPAAAPAASEKALPALDGFGGNDGGDDDFADFQAAPASPPPTQKHTLMEMLNSSQAAPRTGMHGATPSFSQPAMQPQQPMFSGSSSSGGFGAMGSAPTAPARSSVASPNYFGGSGASMGMGMGNMAPTSPPPRTAATSPPASSGAGAQKPQSSGNFDDLWSMSLGSSSAASANKGAGAGKSIKDLEKEKAQAGIWGAQKPPGAAAQGQFGAFGGSFGGAGGGASGGAGGGDDLLL